MKYKLILLFLIFNTLLFSQTVTEGETYFNNKQFAKARSVYEELLKKRPKDGLFNYRYARCCYELNDAEKAIPHFELAGKRYPLRNLYLGELYYNSYRFEESATAYKEYMATLKPADTKLTEYTEKIKKSENAARLMERVEDISIVDSVVVNKVEFLKYFKFNSELGSLNQETIKLNGRKKADRIKYTTQRQDRVYFSDTIKGHLNLYTSYKLLDSWTKPVSISEIINSQANENYPFLLADGVTLYYASDNENSIGGYDLFITRYNPTTDSYLTPENIGMPFNSPFNDYMMVIDDQRKLGWFATDRYQPDDKVMIYTFIPNEVKTIVRSEDKDYIRQVAALKSYHKVIASTIESSSAMETQLAKPVNQIEFILNDTTVYTNINQFKSKEAAKLWTDLHDFSVELNNRIRELSDLRAKYAKTENDSERSVMAPKIMELEQKNTDMKNQLSLKINEVRKTEINFLLDKK
jgi:tetratricopeptide (TPR) repeat protein